MSTVTISIPDQLKKFVSSQMKEKGFDNVSEYFRSLIRDAQAQEEAARFESLLLEGLNSDDIEVTENFWSELKRDAKSLIKKHTRKRKRAA